MTTIQHPTSVCADSGGVGITPAHLCLLGSAVELLENPSFAARVADYTGQPMNAVIDRIPRSANLKLREAIRVAIFKCLTVAITSRGKKYKLSRSEKLAKVLTGVAGGVGGFFGLAALAVELPLTTTLMLRSIAQIASAEGEDLNNVEALLACLEVFTLGIRAHNGKAEEDYYVIRMVLVKLIEEHSPLVLQQGAVNASSPIVAKLVGDIAVRIGLVVSDMAAAGAIPMVGAISGAMVNIIFMDHFQRIAHGHFIVRRLERLYGLENIRTLYQENLKQISKVSRGKVYQKNVKRSVVVR